VAHDAFVSYSQPDRQYAFEIVSHLERAGITAWIAPRDIAPSADWAAEIIDAIAASKVMILVFSSASNNSPQVRREVERAVHHQLPILPLRIEDVLPTRSMEYFLSAQHWLDAFPPPLSDYCERLCGQVQALLRAAMAPQPAGRPNVFPVDQLQPLQSCLAEHVGPLAGYLVKRAAAQAVGWKELVDLLATEIDGPGERKAFIDGCSRFGNR
jgi:hypothetical protein